MSAPSRRGPACKTVGTTHATYIRIYTDEWGESHFAEVSVELFPKDFAPPAAPLQVAELTEASDCYLVGAEPEWAGSTPHPTPQRQIFCILRGRCAITVSDGETREVGPGAFVLLEDTTGKGHSSRVVSSEPLLLLGIRTNDQSVQHR